jgi:type IV pilus assembly protein PilY1
VNYKTLKPYLRVVPTADPADSDQEAINIIDWIRGYDFTGSVTANDFKPYVTDAGHPGGYRQRSITGVTADGSTKTLVWKLGDIIYSTPSVVAKPIENYDMIYNDISYYNYFKNNHNRRHIVYIGANDGTLHAFNGGFFSNKNHQYCTGTPDSNGNCTEGIYGLGEELWSFIPRGILPHLKWLTYPDYTHVYYVDLKPKIADIKIFSSGEGHTDGWGTILIGGYRYGGKDINWTAQDGTPYSSSPEYFALDISDPLNPRLLWTFSHPELGLSMSYPAVAKVGSNWFAVFGSGATDFDAGSNLTSFQNGNVFVLKLSGGGDNGRISSWIENSNFWKIPTGKGISFTANPITVDVDMDYNVDVIYMGENYNDGINWNALMRRITTDNGTESTPGNWDLSTLANVSNISGGKDKAMKITAAPSAAMDDQMNLWTYFGTGQFYGLADKNLTDTGAFYGVKDKCWNGTCSSSYTDFMDVSAAAVKTDSTVSGVNTCAGAPGGGTWNDLIISANSCDGWAMYFDNLLESKDFLGNDLNHGGERVFTKPLVVGGLVAFGSYIPGTTVCEYLGESNAYALYYKTGTAFDTYVFKEQKAGQQTSISSSQLVRLLQLNRRHRSVSKALLKDGKTKNYHDGTKKHLYFCIINITGRLQ